MDRFEPNLRIPGPTALPPSVREAGGRQMINHRGPEFAAMLARIIEGMKPFFGTSNDVAMLTCAGSGGLEAAIVNTLSPGDRVLGVSIGSFGDRFAKIAGVYGADVTKIDVEWGQAADPAPIRDALRANPVYRAVLLTHNETSTGVMNPIAELAATIRDASPETLILVDSVSGLGAVPFEMDAWGVDLVVTGSQKAWMAAPGLAMIAASERGWAATESAKMPRFYLDLRAHRESASAGQTPFTPAIAVVYQVDEGLRLMQAEGKEGIFARHEACAAASRAGLAALGFELFADPRHASKTVTAAKLPEGHDWKPFNTAIKSHGVVLAGGQGKLTGKIFRLGHLGSVTVDEILGAIAVLERVSVEQGRPIEPGRAVAAAQAAALAVQTGGGNDSAAAPAGAAIGTSREPAAAVPA
ncbi:MAG TPA: alanine--glyoxylate aminotransferase family protein [Candidatus Limnocylindrales bacterium]|nr:alanine--glyoxylate aminotransferase family protein [Candidatus Limnocylindrales bacterium]